MATERVDEGRWESEGGQPVHKLTTEASPDAPISDLAKAADAASTTSTAASTTTADSTTAAAATTSTTSHSEYDAGKVHPNTLEGAAGDSAQSHYPSTSSSTTAAATDVSTAASTSSSSTAEKEGASSLQAETAAAPSRKKSISERMAEGWQEFKHKVETVIDAHKKDKAGAEKEADKPAADK